MCAVQSWRFTLCDDGGFWSCGILCCVFGNLTCPNLHHGGVVIFKGW